MLTVEQTRRINQAITECNVFIEKENKCSVDIRPSATQKHLDFCVSHRIKLMKMLETQSWF
jgi:hypothetical protein